MIENSNNKGHAERPQLFENLNKEWLSIDEACKLFPIGKNTFYKYKSNGLPVRRIGRKLVVKKSEVMEWLERWAA